MENFPKFGVNKNGEDQLLEALKTNQGSNFLYLIKAGCCPYIPSPFAQCAAGFKEYWSEEARNAFIDEWHFDTSLTLISCAKPPLALVRRAKSDLTAYTTPILSGIHLAAATNDIATIKKLQKHNTDLDAWGYLPLLYAVGCNNKEAVNALNTPRDYLKMHQGCFRTDPFYIVGPGVYRVPIGMTLKFKLPIINPVNSPLIQAMTIHQAAAKGDMYNLRTLVQLGVPIDIRSFNGSTALLCAALYGQREAYGFLLENGADKKLPNFLGETPSQLHDIIINATGHRKILSVKDQGDTRKETARTEAQETIHQEREVHEERVVPMSHEVVEEQHIEENEEITQEQLVDDLVSAALKGDFQYLVHGFLLLKNKHDIPRDLIDQVSKTPNYPNKDMLMAWLFIVMGCQDKEIMKVEYSPTFAGKELIEKGGTNGVLRYLKDGYGINQSEGLLQYACDIENPGLVRWLLRYGACVDIGVDAVTPFIYKILHNVEKTRQTYIAARPPIINDELLFALTTNNIELLSEYIVEGFDFRKAKTEHGLTLFELAELINSDVLNGYVTLLKQGNLKFHRPEAEEIAKDAPTVTVETPQKEAPGELKPSPKNAHHEVSVPSLIDDDGETGGDEKMKPRSPERQGLAQAEKGIVPSISIEIQVPSPSRDSSNQPVETKQHGHTSFECPELTGGISVLGGDDENEGEGQGQSSGKAGMPPVAQTKEKEQQYYIDRIKLPKGYLAKLDRVEIDLKALPFPRLVILEFLKAQSYESETQLKLHIPDVPTLELFWALKLYAMAKIDELSQ